MSLSSLSRARAAVLGSFVADAATVGVHWIYDQSKVNINKSSSLKIRTRRCCCLLYVFCSASPTTCKGCRRALLGRSSIRHYSSYCLLCNVVELAAAALKDGKTIAFYEPPAGPFYKVKSGDQSPWGHELIPLLRTAAASHSIDAGEYAAACHKYHVDGKDTIPYVNSALREAHAAIEAGKSWQDAATDDTQAHGMGKAPIIVALYAGKPELRAKAEEACKVHQKTKLAIDFAVAAAQLLEKIVLGSSIKESLEWAATPGNLPECLLSSLSTGSAQPAYSAAALCTRSCYLYVTGRCNSSSCSGTS
eukprot:20553-Heterococcus_DN1.PRE.4